MANPFEERRREIFDWKAQTSMKIKENPTILDTAKELNAIGLRSKDALHISCAIFAECNYFLTTDDKILNKNDLIAEIEIVDPISFIKEVYQ